MQKFLARNEHHFTRIISPWISFPSTPYFLCRLHYFLFQEERIYHGIRKVQEIYDKQNYVQLIESLKQDAIKFVNLHRTINILVQFLVEKLQRIIICIIFSIAFMTNTTLHCQKFCLRLPRGCPEAAQRLRRSYTETTQAL